jgi:phosphatidylglycerophosphate synthase
MKPIRELRSICQPPDLDMCLYRRFVVRPVSIHLTRLFIAFGIGADTVSIIKGIIAMAGAVLFGLRPLPAALLLQISFILDACDGEVARFTGSCSRARGEYIDKLGDVGSRSLFHLSWGVGAFLAGGGWPVLAAGAVVGCLWLTVRFCSVETLLESFSNHSGSEGSPGEKAALERLFVRKPGSGRIEHFLSLFIHPWVNLALLAAVASLFTHRGVSGLTVLLWAYTGLWVVNTVRKVITCARVMSFRRCDH